ncbi:MAG: hypothetical protein KDE56_11020 [Anaerolineales bacterium]|nr:hypothetical protein [Anaerolineales bacterium]
MNWYALQTKPHKEFSVYDLLILEGIETYLPFLEVKPVNPRAARKRPYFPGYMFVRVDAETLGANILKWTQGIKGLVSFGGTPAIVPDNFINYLRQHVEVIAAEGLARKQLKPGDNVTIVEGPFAGYEAVFDKYLSGKDRVQVLLAFLSSHPQPIKLDQESVQKRAKHQ